MDLNPSQRAAVEHRDGPLMVVAGPGSGKTRVLTHRIAHLIAGGAPAHSILAITFTNRAAQEMLERTLRLLPGGAGDTPEERPHISTFHSYCARLLRRHAYRLPPYQINFTIYDGDDQESVIEDVLKEKDLDRSSFNPGGTLGRVSSWKNRMLSPEQAFDESRTHADRTLAEVYAAYQKRLAAQNAVDFDDLLLLSLRLLRECPDVLDRERAARRYLLVDEFQDTNLPQYLITRLLAIEHRNLCITGDPDQSIYSWRGASPANFDSFAEDFAERKVILLNQNYRSTPEIIAAAARLTRTQFGERPLFTENAAGEEVAVVRVIDERREAAWAVEAIEAWQAAGAPLREIALLYRLNAQTRALEEALVRARVPYTIVGGISFYQRREVKDVLSYLRAASFPRDEIAIRRVLNVPNRGIGSVTLDQIAECAARNGLALGELVLERDLWEQIPGRGRAALAGFADILARLRDLRSLPLNQQVLAVIAETRYAEHLEKSDPEGWRDRMDNLDELANAAAETEDMLGRAIGTRYGRGPAPRDVAEDGTQPDGMPRDALSIFLERVALVSDIDTWEDRADRVALMTLHSAKGLEFDRVIITGVEDQLLPHVRSDGPRDTDEERRLLYVGLTRARKSARLLHCAYRRRFQHHEPRLPSPFLREIAGDGVSSHTEYDPAGRGGRAAFPGGDPFDAYDDADGGDELCEGVRIDHDLWGPGTVIATSGRGDTMRVTVRFEEHGDKQFVVGYMPFRVIETPRGRTGLRRRSHEEFDFDEP